MKDFENQKSSWGNLLEAFDTHFTNQLKINANLGSSVISNDASVENDL